MFWEFKKRNGVEWDIVIVDSTLEELGLDGLAGLTSIKGVLVTIFLNRDGTVLLRPATGEAHRKAKAELKRLTAEILDGL